MTRTSAPPVPGSSLESRGAVAQQPRVVVRALVGAVDALIVALALLLATAIRAPRSVEFDILPERMLVVCGLMLSGLALYGAYDLDRVRSGRQLAARLTFGALVGLGLVVLATYVVPSVTIGRGIFALTAILALPMLVLWRRLVFRALREDALRGRAVILGEPTVARKIARALSEASWGGADVVGILAPPGAQRVEDEEGSEGGFEVLGSYERVADVVRAHEVTRAIVVDGTHARDLPLETMLSLRKAGLGLEAGADAYESVTGRLLVEKLTPGVFVFASAFEPTPAERNLRRVIAVVVAGVALAVISPLLALVALAILVDSPGPVLFRQERVGEQGRRFELLKFRTMRQDAESATGPVWASENDPRVTRLGRFLRSTRIDELPQLWNVVRGDMYFVGPRPERPHFVEMLKARIPLYDYRHAVPPGISGWAQINYGYGASVEDAAEKLHYDLYYIQNMSAFLDLEIIVGTIQKVLGAANRN